MTQKNETPETFDVDTGPLCVACGKCRMKLRKPSVYPSLVFCWRCDDHQKCSWISPAYKAESQEESEAAALADAPRLNARALAANWATAPTSIGGEILNRAYEEMNAAKAERDAATARAEKAERERDTAMKLGQHYADVLKKAADLLSPETRGRTDALIVIQDLPKALAERDALKAELAELRKPVAAGGKGEGGGKT